MVLGERLELVLEAPAHEAVVHLRRHIFLQTQALLEHDRGGRLPGHQVGKPDIANLSLSHQVVERTQRLLEGGVAVPSVHLVQIDVIGLEPTKAALDLPQDVHAGRAAPVEVLTHRQPDFGGQHDLLPDALQGVAQECLALPTAIDVGRVDEIDAMIQRELHHPVRLILAQVAHVHLAAELHAAERHFAHDQAGMSQCSVPHVFPSLHRN